MDLSGILRDARIDELPTHLGISTRAGAESLRRGFNGWTTNTAYLKERGARFQTMRTILKNLDTTDAETLTNSWNTISEYENIVEELRDPPSDFEEESYGQLLFMSEHTKFMNNIPKLLAIWCFVKSYILPLVSLSVPLIAFFGPFIVVKYIMHSPITFSEYMGVAQKMYLGGTIFGGEAAAQDLGGRMRSIMQTAWGGVTLVQSLYQPIQTALHIQRLDHTLMEKGGRLRAFVRACSNLRNLFERHGIRVPRLPVPAEIHDDERRLVAFFLDNRAVATLLLHWIGSWDVACTLALNNDFVAVHWLEAARSPVIRIRGTTDILISRHKRVSMNFDLGRRHALLTGPNRGGKSTALRSLLRSVLFAHTYGVVIGRSAQMTAFDWIQSCLRLEDLPGQASLFEREVQFAASSLRRPGRGLVLIDELFHSTNPPDAEAASRLYLGRLWAERQILSVISTHVFALVDDAPQGIQRLCCPATVRDDGGINYKYGLQEGICRVSSVNDILRETRLLIRQSIVGGVRQEDNEETLIPS